jgi:hypothetical protein
MAALNDKVFKGLIRYKFDARRVFITSNKFFGKNIVNFVAIDGTEYSKSNQRLI